MFFGDSLTFGCNEGVELIGNDVLQCVLDDELREVKWSAPVPYCFGKILFLFNFHYTQEDDIHYTEWLHDLLEHDL